MPHRALDICLEVVFTTQTVVLSSACCHLHCREDDMEFSDGGYYVPEQTWTWPHPALIPSHPRGFGQLSAHPRAPCTPTY